MTDKIVCEHEDLDQQYYNLKDDHPLKKEESNVECTCGGNLFRLNHLPYPYSGMYLKLTCAGCGTERVLMDDFS